ncbi:hypothetical protein [Alteraurantiacibacter palmitatis]|uniref:Stress-induced protein n=1 Tax=Alteraurantiacibacter palmitatis TaxID=2054628 RepID=A0ABV7E6B0_9SPHN
MSNPANTNRQPAKSKADLRDVANAGPDKGRKSRDMQNTARGSEGDIRRASGMKR